MSRKMPILLRRGPLSGDVMALYRYRHKTLSNGADVIDCGSDGKQDVTADFDALVLMELVDKGCDDIVGILDGVADGETLNDEERGQIREFRERLKALILRHNARLDNQSSERWTNTPSSAATNQTPARESDA